MSLKQKIASEPVMVTGGVTGVIMAFLAMAASLGWFKLNDAQMESIRVFVVALAGVGGLAVPLLLSWLARGKVTPLANTRTEDGQPAVLVPMAEERQVGLLPEEGEDD